MKSRIIDELERIELDNDVSVIYACESGSRAWGFDYEGSDYDVRFIYKRNNVKEYLSLSQKSDVIESADDDLDIVGWDITKALKLHYKSNPNLREWILSPIVYIGWKEDIFKGLPDFDGAILKFHYTNIARNNWRTLKDNPDPTKKVVKLYLYNCRCILIWMVINGAGNPHINIYDLLEQADFLDGAVKSDINDLVTYYKSGCRGNLDLNVTSRINHWMGEYIELMRNDIPEKQAKHDLNVYDDRLFDIIFPNYG